MKSPLAPALLAFLLAGCLGSAPPRSADSVLRGDAAHPERSSNWVRTELYFGLAPVVAGADASTTRASDARRWQDFLDAEVTPRFPDGLSVYDVYGQWRTQGHDDIERLHSKELMLLYPDSARHRADIEAIRAAWKKLTGDLSVLRVTQPADVSF